MSYFSLSVSFSVIPKVDFFVRQGRKNEFEVAEDKKKFFLYLRYKSFRVNLSTASFFI